MRSLPRAIGFLLLLLVAGACLVLLALRPTEPRYNGKPLSFWITKYESYSVYPHNNEAWDAVRAIGTNAIPVLLRWNSYETPEWRKNLSLLDRKHVHTGILELGYPREYELATEGFSILGTNALPALPALVKLMNQTDKRDAAMIATSSLAYLGPQTLPYLATVLSSKNLAQRAAAVSSIRFICEQGAPVEACLGPLLTATADPDPRVRQLATNALARIAPALLTKTLAK